MLVPICPTCGNLLANIQIPYQRDMKNLCIEYNVNKESLSRGLIYDEEFNKKKIEILDKYIDNDRYCCRMRLTNFINIVELVH